MLNFLLNRIRENRLVLASLLLSASAGTMYAFQTGTAASYTTSNAATTATKLVTFDRGLQLAIRGSGSNTDPLFLTDIGTDGDYNQIVANGVFANKSLNAVANYSYPNVVFGASKAIVTFFSTTDTAAKLVWIDSNALKVKQTIKPAVPIYGSAFGANKFIFGSSNGRIYATHQLDVPMYLVATIAGNPALPYVAGNPDTGKVYVASPNQVWQSEGDLSTWTSILSIPGEQIHDMFLAYNIEGGGDSTLFVSTSDPNAVEVRLRAYSESLATWRTSLVTDMQTLGNDENRIAISQIASGSHWVVCSDRKGIMTDGNPTTISWSDVPTLPDASHVSTNWVGFGSGTFISVGNAPTSSQKMYITFDIGGDTVMTSLAPVRYETP